MRERDLFFGLMGHSGGSDGELKDQLIGILNGGLSDVVVPEGVTKIRYYLFNGETELRNISFPTSLTSIGGYAFNNCTNLVLTSLPDGLTSIEIGAFYKCTGLTEITFKSTPTKLASCFGSCTNLTTINVPWAEGEVSGAPWGATNATINYNYVGE